MELIDHIEVYHAEKQVDIIMETRKGVALSYAPEQVAV